MIPTTLHRFAGVSVAAAVALLALLSARDGQAPSVWPMMAAYAALMLVPGLTLYLLVERDPEPLAALAAACALSPVVLAAIAVPSMVSGAHALAAARAVIVLSCAALALVTLRGTRGDWRLELSTRQLAVLSGFIVALCTITAFLPMTDEWWRMRSDAWAHWAYIADAADFGVPPQDPFFLGFPLQYMWAYHVLILVVSDAANIDPFRTMALLNVQALAGLALATYLVAGELVSGFARRMTSVIAVTLGLNACFWVFLPFKFLRAFSGEVRGLEEIAKMLSLSPFTFRNAYHFMQIFHNKTFFLDKFMVGTAFGLGLCLMAVVWWAALRYLRSRDSGALVMLFFATLGLLAFHTLVGSVMLAGVVGGCAVLFLIRSRVDGYALIPSIAICAVMLAALAVASPYLYSVMHSKATVGQTGVVPFASRLVGVTISVAFVLVLAWFQRWIVRDRRVSTRWFCVAAAVIAVYSLAVPLPGPNSVDKPPFFVFFPLAVVGGWSLVDLFKRRRRTALVVALLGFVPVTAIAIAASFNTPPEWHITDDERALASWLQENTNRDAVLMDADNHLDFVVLGPRRHYWGRLGFADQWGYDRVEMARRFHAWGVTFSRRPLDANTLSALGSVEQDFYVIIRSDLHAEGVNATTNPVYFQRAYTVGSLSLWKVDGGRCRADSESGRFPVVSEEELLRESGLN